MKRLALLLAAGLLASSGASAYYHWIYFVSRTGDFVPIRLKFDLAATTANTVPYFISSDGPSPMMEGDSFPALVSQIRRAADTWNQVPTSAVRLGFGGMGEIGLEQAAPGIDVIFDDEMPPGVLAQSWPQTYEDLSFLAPEPLAEGEEEIAPAETEKFAPILRARLQLRKDLTLHRQASWSDAFFMTIVHEFGHTLGLQHSLTSSTMSTSLTRATTKASPLAADDIAGLSVLYPTPEFAATTGTISGRVMAGGRGMNLASVVALSTDGVAISALSNPDGTYKIEGVPAGDYYVYAHPLPPAVSDEAAPAGIVYPIDLSGQPFSEAPAFATRFYPGTTNWQEAAVIHVTAGDTLAEGATELASAGIDFHLDLREAPAIHSMQTFAYFGAGNQVSTEGLAAQRGVYYVHAPPMQAGIRDALVIHAPGTFVPGQAALAPGLAVSEVGSAAGIAPETLQYWADAPGDFLLLAVNPPAPEVPDTEESAEPGPVDPTARPIALAFTTADDLYVLPSALTVVPQQIPEITAITQNRDEQGNELAYLSGVNLDQATRVLFDGAEALSMRIAADGSIAAMAPPATGNHEAVVSVLDASGRSTGQLTEGVAPPRFRYSKPERITLITRPGDVVAGTDTLIEVSGAESNFLAGDTEFGFGTSDITVRQAWIQSKNHALLNVAVGPNARTGSTTVTAATGIELANLETVVLVHPAGPEQVSLHAPITNELTGLAGVPNSGIARIPVTGLTSERFGDGSGWSLTIGGVPASFTFGEGVLLATVPEGANRGPAVVTFSGPGDPVPSILMQVDDQPPAIVAANPAGFASAEIPEYLPGDRIRLTVGGLTELFGPLPEHVDVFVGGVEHPVAHMEHVGQLGWIAIELVLGETLASGQQPVVVRIGTRQSAEFPIQIAAPAAPESSAEPAE